MKEHNEELNINQNVKQFTQFLSGVVFEQCLKVWAAMLCIKSEPACVPANEYRPHVLTYMSLTPYSSAEREIAHTCF